MNKGIVWVVGNGREFSIANHPVLIKKYKDEGYDIIRYRNGRKVYC